MTTIRRNGTGSTSRLGSVGCNPYPSANHFSQRAWWQMLSTYRGLDSSASRICYRQKGGEDTNPDVGPNADATLDVDTDAHATLDVDTDAHATLDAGVDTRGNRRTQDLGHLMVTHL
ncbi:hypothetical protein Gogos_018338 [Gossypium gossypioides]|uniref:Uncharacterized protein n=1 Tax=Gossypium gossypioides TaxID=34282 RepID=A0A7J9BDP1_GOSGO|nr:hypothetical protein [Gossypium gossypioides]